MMYEYMEFADQTLVTHSRVLGEGNSETVQVRFERPKMGGLIPHGVNCRLIDG